LLFPLLLANHLLVLFLCVSFGGILIVSLKYKLLRSINGIDRPSVGSLAYPVSVYFCYLAYDHFGHNYTFYYLPILILAICDPLAALFGKQWPLGRYSVGNENKTLVGSAFFFISAFIISVIFIFLNTKNTENSTLDNFLAAGVIALVSTISEAVSGKGLDNLTIPASVVFVLILNNLIF
jgi:dolichol kinase